ncbi:hypothetical protein [uncultured Slackia sp.]|uniref:hypothetical protein n=1 Tax=uncultured Slackia sp. TaxID=665903 RepID=UPI0026765504|nr:hypothetical protein [uncultured Slackia sp.]
MCHSFQKTALATALSNVTPSERVFRSKERNAFPLEALFLQIVSNAVFSTVGSNRWAHPGDFIPPEKALAWGITSPQRNPVVRPNAKEKIRAAKTQHKICAPQKPVQNRCKNRYERYRPSNTPSLPKQRSTNQVPSLSANITMGIRALRLIRVIS